jgi:hypothetical protein
MIIGKDAEERKSLYRVDYAQSSTLMQIESSFSTIQINGWKKNSKGGPFSLERHAEALKKICKECLVSRK